MELLTTFSCDWVGFSISFSHNLPLLLPASISFISGCAWVFHLIHGICSHRSSKQMFTEDGGRWHLTSFYIYWVNPSSSNSFLLFFFFTRYNHIRDGGDKSLSCVLCFVEVMKGEGNEFTRQSCMSWLDPLPPPALGEPLPHKTWKYRGILLPHAAALWTGDVSKSS